MPADSKSYTYTGNPGYVFYLPGRTLAVEPGDVVELDEAEVALVGDEFQPVKPKPASTDAKTPKDDQ